MTTVLVLGAGSSIAFGYPTGKGLRDQILKLPTMGKLKLTSDIGLRDDMKRFDHFIKAFRNSDQDSIDAFLATRLEFAEIGKLCIAATLLEKESENTLFVQTDEDRWAAYLQNRLSANEWDLWDYSNLKIVTFNYDRALEHYLLLTLRYRYNKTIEEAVQKLATLEIVHIYGSLGPTLPGAKNYTAYGAGVTKDVVTTAARSLQVIPEGRDTDASLVRARELLTAAETVVFLGFGFDRTNMERLDARNTCARRTQTFTAQGMVDNGRNVLATCVGMTLAEARQAYAYFHKEQQSGKELPPGFHDKRCEGLFRETLVLDSIAPAVNWAPRSAAVTGAS